MRQHGMYQAATKIWQDDSEQTTIQPFVGLQNAGIIPKYILSLFTDTFNGATHLKIHCKY